MPVKKDAIKERKAPAKHPSYELTSPKSMKFVKERDQDCQDEDLPSPEKTMPARPPQHEALPKLPEDQMREGGIVFQLTVGRAYFCCQYCGMKHSARAEKKAKEWATCSICRRAQHTACVQKENGCFCQKNTIRKSSRNKKN